MRPWREGTVRRDEPHFVLSHDDISSPLALLGRAGDTAFVVELVAEPEATSGPITELRDALDYYLEQLGEPDPWAYAIHHAGTSANVYSRIHWRYVDPQTDA